MSTVRRAHLVAPSILTGCLPPRNKNTPIVVNKTPISSTVSARHRLLCGILFSVHTSVGSLGQVVSRLLRGPYRRPIHSIGTLLSAATRDSTPICTTNSIPIFTRDRRIASRPPHRVAGTSVRHRRVVHTLHHGGNHHHRTTTRLFVSRHALCHGVGRLNVRRG